MTEELRQALWELEEEKEKWRDVEEMNSKVHEQDNLNNKFSALMEESTKENVVTLQGNEAAETCLLASAYSPSEEGDDLIREDKTEELLVVSLQETTRASDCAKQSPNLRNDNQLQTLQV